MAEDAPEGQAGAPSDAPASGPRDAVVMALVELKRVVNEAAEAAPETAGTTSMAQLLSLPVLQEPLDAQAIAAELLAAGSHIKLLQKQNKQQKATIEALKAEKIQLIKAVGGAPAADAS